MSTGFKVSSLASKLVFYRPEHKANGGPWNGILKFFECKDEIKKRVDEKNGIKMFKNGKNHVYFQSYDYQNVEHGSFLYFLLMTAKI